jgi:proline dehydrogenase
VGGDSALQVVPLLRDLRSKNKGALFAYSIEVDEREATSTTKKKADMEPTYKRIVNEMIRCIDVAADFEDGVVGDLSAGRRTWVAVKMVRIHSA